MYKVVLILLLFFCKQLCFSQQDFKRFDITFSNYRIDSNDNFNVVINLASNSYELVSVPLKPIVTDFSNENGHLRFRLEKVIDSCYSPIEIMTDVFFPQINKGSKTLNRNQTMTYKYNLQSLYFFRRGHYRLKAFLTYKKNEIALDTETSWIYFDVISDRFSRIKN